jgi:putative phosphoribosyl transferase
VREIHIALLPLIESPESLQPSPWVVLVAHGKAWRDHPGQRAIVLDILHGYGFGTCSVDVSATADIPGGPDEPMVDWLADRLQETVAFLKASRDRDPPRIGAIGVGEAAAPVLLCAAKGNCVLAAVACLDGRQRIPTATLEQVHTPTLLIAGSDDAVGLEANRAAVLHLRGSKRLEVIPGATASFDAPGAIDTIGHLAGTWFVTHLTHFRAY